MRYARHRVQKCEACDLPHFWFFLARARNTARSLGNTASLSQTAIDAGFADQSHMNREIKKWFGQTPAQIKLDDGMFSVLAEPGFGNWQLLRYWRAYLDQKAIHI